MYFGPAGIQESEYIGFGDGALPAGIGIDFCIKATHLAIGFRFGDSPAFGDQLFVECVWNTKAASVRSTACVRL